MSWQTLVSHNKINIVKSGVMVWVGINWSSVWSIRGSSLTGNKNSRFIKCTTFMMTTSGDAVDGESFDGDCREISSDSHCVGIMAVVASG